MNTFHLRTELIAIINGAAASYQNSQRTKEDNRSVGSRGESKTTRNHQAELRDTTSSPKTLKYYIYRSFH